MKLTYIIGLVAAIMTISTSCKKGCTDSEAVNYEEKAKKDDGSCVYDNTYSIPTTYSFTDEDGNSTVNFSGQHERLNMLSEMVDYLKTANTKGTLVDAATLKNMFANDNYTWIDSEGLGMTGSSKQLKDKCANGDAIVTAMFETYMDSVSAISAVNQDGSAGISGVYPNDGAKGPYLMSANGVEYTQWIEKGLMGAVFYYQMTNAYFGSSKMDVDNTTAEDPDNGKYYTKMEHHWDEAFGYFTSEVDYPTNGTDRFYGKYAASVEDILSSQTNIMNAFLKGRAAISNDDLTTRDKQITIIRDEMENIIAATAIHYLNEAIHNITKNTARNHVLSEATAFIDALRYGHNAIEEINISKTEIDDILSTIGDDFNSVTVTNLNKAKDDLAGFMGLTSVKDQL